MAIVVESTTTSAYDTTNDTSINLTKPSGLVAGDLLVSVVGLDANGISVSTKTGWTSSGAGVPPGDGYIKVQYKIADSSDASATDFTFNYSGTVNGDFGILYRISGVSPTLTLDSSDSDSNSLQASYSFSTSLTPSYSNSLVLLSFLGDDDSAPTIENEFTTPSITFTEDYNSAGGTIRVNSLHGTKSDTTEITAYGADSSDGTSSGSAFIGVISVFTPIINASGTTNLITTTTTLNTGDGSAGTSGSANMAAANTKTFNIAGTAEQEIWTNQNRSSTTWTNQNKS